LTKEEILKYARKAHNTVKEVTPYRKVWKEHVDKMGRDRWNYKVTGQRV
jgi:hypothetical protein